MGTSLKKRTLEFQCVKLGQQALNALPNLVALSDERVDFLLQPLQFWQLLVEFGFGFGGLFLGFDARLPLVLHHFDGADNTLFKRRKITALTVRAAASVSGFCGGDSRFGLTLPAPEFSA